ncbi:MAG TPA: EamA family transporter RarD [Desulfuromonadales bacterium]|nr:EamA family transporter RarD [Desulfuromonadales bacterium]
MDSRLESDEGAVPGGKLNRPRERLLFPPEKGKVLAMTTAATSTADRSRQGIIFGLSAYLVWGCFPLFFKAVETVGPLEVVAHRVCWAMLFLLLTAGVRSRLGEVVRTLKNPALLGTLCISTLLIGTNWLVFIYAVENGEVLQSSLGYFLNPLVSVLLGFLFLHERLSRRQKLSVLCAALGVLTLTLYLGRVPWIALALACSFGLYGLLRKIARVEALVGQSVEALLLAPFALGYLLYLYHQGTGAFLAGSLRFDLLLPMTGIVTAVPLLLFVGAARRLRLATIGFMQYITPTLHFVWAVGVFHEAFSRVHLVSFALIWLGLALYSAEALRQARLARS